MTMAPNSKIKLANFITLKAKPGQEEKLADFLAGGASAVAATEPATLSWYAVRMDANTFGIIDFFADQAGQDAHVSGQVAAALKASADQMIVGGWDDGVLKHFQVFEVLSAAA
jgi:quinol monooxygenase YgiN